MKNEDVYYKYSIDGWPCYFFTLTCADMYNAKLEKYCNKLHPGAEDLSKAQKYKLVIYKYFYLSFLDSILAIYERIKGE